MLSTTQKQLTIYQAQTWIASTGYTVLQQEEYSQPCDCEYYKIFKTIQYLNVLQDTNVDIYLTEQQQETIYKCLISSLQLGNFPSSGVPFTFQTVPTILYGLPGSPGAPGSIGPQGPTGLATDFASIGNSISVIVDSFNISLAKAARWEYLVVNNSGNQRAGTVTGQWNPAGTLFSFYDWSLDDIVGATTGIEFTVPVTGSTVQLNAVITSGTWNIYGSRYFTPTNGTGSGPISDVLVNNYIYVGNISNVATGVPVTGDITITNTGVVSISSGVIVNSDISAGAGINLSKLAALTASRIAVTDGSGIITTINTPSLTTLGYLDASSSIQTQLTSKLTDPMTSIGDIIIRNASNITTRLPIGSALQVLQVSGGVPVWAASPGGISGLTTGYIPKALSATSLGDSVISQSGSVVTFTGSSIITSTSEFQGGYRTAASGAYLKTKILNIGNWTMWTLGAGVPTPTFTIAHGLSDIKKIRSIEVTIIPDANNNSYSLFTGVSTSNTTPQGFERRDATNITLTRLTGGFFDSAFFDTIVNRGYITITYEV